MPDNKKAGKYIPRYEGYAIILFADLIDSSLFSNVLGLTAYYDLLRQFQKTMGEVIKSAKKMIEREKGFTFYWDVIGDQANVFLFAMDMEKLNSKIILILDLAIQMKFRWLKSVINSDRIKSHKITIDIGIGIHVGPVAKGQSIIKKDKSHSIIGYTISTGKRLESSSREGKYFKIMMSIAAAVHVEDFFDFGLILS